MVDYYMYTASWWLFTFVSEMKEAVVKKKFLIKEESQTIKQNECKNNG